MNAFNLYEAYTAVYDEDLREDILTVEENFEFIDDLSDNELTQIMEEILSEREVTLNECLEVFDYEILSEESEMSRMNRLANKRAREKKSAAATATRMKSAERERVGRKHAVKRLQVATTRAAKNISDRAKEAGSRAKTLAGGAVSAAAGGAAEAGRKVQRGAEKVKGKLASAKEKIKGFIKSGRKAAAGGLRNLAAKVEPKETPAAKPKAKEGTPENPRVGQPAKERPALPPGRTVTANRRSLAAKKLENAAAGEGPTEPQQGQPAGTFKDKKSRREARKREARLTAKESFELLDLLIDDLIAEGYVSTESEAYDLIENLDVNETYELVESYISEDTVDLYDIILEHLIDEGYADTEEAATVIMANMSEEWREEILDESVRGSQRSIANRITGDDIRSVTDKDGKTKYNKPKWKDSIQAQVRRGSQLRRSGESENNNDRRDRERIKANKKSINRLNAEKNIEHKQADGDYENSIDHSRRGKGKSGYMEVPTDYRARRRRASGR
jgi:hypothetical protein